MSIIIIIIINEYIQIAKEQITETESDQASPVVANEYSLSHAKSQSHKLCTKSMGRKCVQKVFPKSVSKKWVPTRQHPCKHKSVMINK